MRPRAPAPLKCDSTNALRPGLGGGGVLVSRGLRGSLRGSAPAGEFRGCAGAGAAEKSAPGGLQPGPSRRVSSPPRMPACRALSWCAPGAGHGECVAGLLRLELGERLGLQLPGGGPRLLARGPPG